MNLPVLDFVLVCLSVPPPTFEPWLRPSGVGILTDSALRWNFCAVGTRSIFNKNTAVHYATLPLISHQPDKEGTLSRGNETDPVPLFYIDPQSDHAADRPLSLHSPSSALSSPGSSKNGGILFRWKPSSLDILSLVLLIL